MKSKMTPTVANALAQEISKSINTYTHANQTSIQKNFLKSADGKLFKKSQEFLVKAQKTHDELMTVLNEKYPDLMFNKYNTIPVVKKKNVYSIESIKNRILIEGFVSNDGETGEEFINRITKEIIKTL
jgi:hypothetical protein